MRRRRALRAADRRCRDDEPPLARRATCGGERIARGPTSPRPHFSSPASNIHTRSLDRTSTASTCSGTPRSPGSQPSGPRRAAGRTRRYAGPYLFNELGFFGNREQYDDPRNSCLNEVLDRRTGIPISLASCHRDRAPSRLRAEGINFPGPFPRARAASRSAHRRSRRSSRSDRSVSLCAVLSEQGLPIAAAPSYGRWSGVRATLILARATAVKFWFACCST